MKKILFAMAVLAALASCQKADLAEQNSVNTNGERVITAYFDNAGTKTTLDGVTPKWEPNDEIMLLNGSTHDKITLGESNISADGKSITFTTTLSGPLYAVYPLDATDADRIVTENIVPVTLKAEQDGTFGSANICVAKEDDGKLAFKNVTSVLHLTQTVATTNVNEIIITTPSAYIAGTGTVDMSETTPTLALSPGQSKKIKVKSASPQSDYYIAVAPTTLPAGTAFGFATGSKLGGTNLSEERAIVANTIYHIGSMDALEIAPHTYHDYVEIGGLKWATMNVGATSATEAGHYFAWGYTDGCVRNTAGDGWVLASDNTTEKQFNTEDFPNRDASSFKDAATANWGGSWRMPIGGTTEGDFIALFRACGIASGYQCTPTPYGGTGTENEGVYWCDDYDDSGVKGVLFIAEDNETRLFFPAAGHGDNAKLVVETDSYGRYGYYLSSTIANATMAYCLYIGNGENKVAAGGTSKYFGWSVRPVSD